ncbi:MAG TPA: hypothetical protein VGL66_10250 [Caulobacteraceae bacterium]|jgi:hypothetical protein
MAGGYRFIGMVVAVAAVTSACAKHKDDSVAVWTAKPGAGADASRIELSSEAVESSLPAGDKTYSPSVRIVCRSGRPNVELEPLFAKCAGYCGQNPAMDIEESFLTNADPHPRLASVERKPVPASPPFDQDLLSNTPDQIVTTGDAKSGVTQPSVWTGASGDRIVVRFNYGSDQASVDYITRVDQQARNYINRIAASRSFSIGQGGAMARFDARGLSAKLPAFWAACPGPKAAP